MSETIRPLHYWVAHLGLLPHPEGGFYQETYRATGLIQAESLPSPMQGQGANNRSYATGIYFLLTGDTFSAFHRIQSDEMWHYYTGSHPLEVLVIHPDGRLQELYLGPDPTQGQSFQAVVPAGAWFASRVLKATTAEAYALVGCTVAPGFDFADFELASAQSLSAQYPQHTQLIKSLCRLS